MAGQLTWKNGNIDEGNWDNGERHGRVKLGKMAMNT